LLIGTVLLATLFPATGSFEHFMHIASNAAISLLFFLHGAKLSREAALSGLKQPRLHLLTLGSTFILFPLLGLALKSVVPDLLTPQLWMGVLFVCTLSPPCSPRSASPRSHAATCRRRSAAPRPPTCWAS
jgi:sodium/bile acid cotransporter 7